MSHEEEVNLYDEEVEDSIEEGVSESIESVDSEGLVATRSKRQHINRKTVEDEDDIEFWHQDAWMQDDGDSSWDDDDIEGDHKDIIDDDFDCTESSDGDVAKRGKDADKYMKEQDTHRQSRRKQKLAMQEQLLRIISESLQVKEKKEVEVTAPSLLAVASNFNMPNCYVEGKNPRYPGWKGVLLSAKNARQSQTPSKKKSKDQEEVPARGTQEYYLYMAAKQEEIAAIELKAKQEHLANTHFQKSAVKSKVGLKLNPCAQNGPFEIWISWDGTRTIEYEEQSLARRGIPSMADHQNGEPFERQLIFFANVSKKGSKNPMVPFPASINQSNKDH